MVRPPKSRIALLAAAERIFAERGLAGARTEQIAAAAAVNKAMLHYYFDTKEKLYHSVLDSLVEQFREKVLNPLAGAPTPTDALFDYVDRHITFLSEHPHFPRLIQRAMMTGGPHLRSLVRNFQLPVSERLRAILRSGIRRGEFRRVDVDQALISLAGITVFYFIVAPVVGLILSTDPYSNKLVRARKRAVIDFVAHGLLADPKRMPRTRGQKTKRGGKRTARRRPTRKGGPA